MLQLYKLRMRFHVRFDTENMHKEFDYNDKVYASINYVSFITLENIANPEMNDLSKSIMITEKNIFSVITMLNAIINRLYKHDIYAYENEKLIIYDDEIKKHTIVTRLYGGGSLMVRPTIVYDENDMSYEGVTLFINNTMNGIDLPIDALESLRYYISKIDFFLYSQALINYHILYYGINNSTVEQKKQSTEKRYIQWEDKSGVSANFRRKGDEMLDLFNMK